MDNVEALRLLEDIYDNAQLGDEEYYDAVDIAKDCVYKMLRIENPKKLTLAELKEMQGQPVWVEEDEKVEPMLLTWYHIDRGVYHDMSIPTFVFKTLHYQDLKITENSFNNYKFYKYKPKED